MRCRFLLPLLAVALLATEASQAQTTPAPRKPGRMLTARERRAQDAAARAEATRAAQLARATPAPAGTTTWNGWSNEPLAADHQAMAPHRSVTNVSVAPGMPLNQIGHGVSTDYNGRPLAPAVASTTLSSGR